jgi:hypothetical protein
MQEWFYVKNDLDQREDIRGIIQHPIWSCFGIRRPSVALGNDVQACQMAFNTICTYIGTRVWPLASGWEMPKEAAAGSSQHGLVYLKYTFRFRDQFDEPNDDWLGAIEATSDELLGSYSRTEDEAMIASFGARGKMRLNRVFDVIGFMYPDYYYPTRKQGKKTKTVTSATSSVLKSNKIKVLTHRPRRIEMTEVSMLIEESTSISEPSRSVPVEARTEPVEEPKLKKAAEQPKALSPPRETELPKASRIPIMTPRKRRMASVLDAVMESVKASTPASAEAPSAEGKILKKSNEVGTVQAAAEAGPSSFTEARHAETAPPILGKEGAVEESPATEAPTKKLEFIVRHASGKQLSKKQIAEARQYVKDLKYPRGSLVYSGNDEDDFLYCLPDNKAISVCWEITRNMGFPKLELDLSAMSKDDLADILAYNSLKVHILFLVKMNYVCRFFLQSLCSNIFLLLGLILSRALRAQKEAEDESCQAVAEPPELFQLKCPRHALEAATHLNRNNPSVPQI